jgi:hypothetical protein
MAKMFAALKARVMGSPLSTLSGTLIGAINLGLHEAIIKIDWTNTKQVVTAALTSAIPVVIGALMKSTPKLDPQTAAIAQQISDAVAAKLQQATTEAVDKAVAHIQSFGTTPTKTGTEGGATE